MPAPSTLTPLRSRQALRLLAALLLAAAGCAGDAPRRTGMVSDNGRLTVEGSDYTFRTSFCDAGAAHFAAVGHGTDHGRPFVITVKSPDVVSVKFGVSRELDSPPPDATWLYATSTMRLQADGRAIHGDGTLVERQLTGRPARVELVCSQV